MSLLRAAVGFILWGRDIDAIVRTDVASELREALWREREASSALRRHALRLEAELVHARGMSRAWKRLLKEYRADLGLTCKPVVWLCPKVSHLYGEPCERVKGHDGPCFGASGDGFFGCDPEVGCGRCQRSRKAAAEGKEAAE